MPNIDYITVISPVKEVTLWGKADARPWQTYLLTEELAPQVEQEQVELLLSAVVATYKGVRFQELSVSIALSTQEYFLVHAYNSIPLFALAERKLFRTPYYGAKLAVTPHTIRLNSGQDFVAELASSARCLRTAYEDWELVIRLPKALRPTAHRPHFFYARLQGETAIYQADLSVLSMNGAAGIFSRLRASHFQPYEWRCRLHATHSKSKTLQEGS